MSVYVPPTLELDGIEITRYLPATKVNFRITEHRFSGGSMWYFIRWDSPTPNPGNEALSWVMEKNLPRGALDVEYLNAYKAGLSIL